MTVEHPFERLDFVYMPSGDVAADADHLVGVIGAQLIFAIEAFGTRVAMLQLADESPALLLAGHLEGERPILVYRVSDLEQTPASWGPRSAARFTLRDPPRSGLRLHRRGRPALRHLPAHPPGGSGASGGPTGLLTLTGSRAPGDR